jgi:hypothetical protein
MVAGPSGEAGFAQAGTHSGIHALETVIVRSPEEWEALWSRHVADRIGTRREPPLVGFQEQLVVGFFAGDRPTGGYAVRFLGLEGCLAKFELRHPPPGAVLTQAITQPYAMAAITRTDLPIRFEVVEVRPG